MIDHRQSEQAVALRQLGDLFPISVRTYGDRLVHHGLVESHPGPREHQVPERHHADQQAPMIDHVDIGEVLDLVVELAETLDGFPRGHPHLQECHISRHQPARRVRSVLEESQQLVGDPRIEAGQYLLPVLLVQLAEEVGRHVGIHGGDEIRSSGRVESFENINAQLGAHLVEDSGCVSGVEVGEEVGGRVGVQFLEDVRRVMGVGAGQFLPLGGMRVQVLLDLVGLDPGRAPQPLGEFPWPGQLYSHRLVSTGVGSCCRSMMGTARRMLEEAGFGWPAIP